MSVHARKKEREWAIGQAQEEVRNREKHGERGKERRGTSEKKVRGEQEWTK